MIYNTRVSKFNVPQNKSAKIYRTKFFSSKNQNESENQCKTAMSGVTKEPLALETDYSIEYFKLFSVPALKQYLALRKKQTNGSFETLVAR